MNIYRKLLYALNKGSIVITLTMTGLLAGTIPALASPGNWTTGNCSGTSDFKKALQSLTSTVWGWAMIVLIALTAIALVALPFTALSKRRELLSKIILFLGLVFAVELLGTAILGLMIAKANCAG